jgi:ABC-type nitrate/sulfonate/bicarbonate transport system substrate-binding protein
MAAAGLFALGCSSEPQQVDVAYSPFEPTALVWIAEDRQFFSHNGLEVTFLKSDTGPSALDSMLRGEANVAVGIGEFPMVGRVLQGTAGRVVASMDRSELIGVVARKDRGIAEVGDLKGKRIGTTRGTIAEFFLGRFLELHGMSLRDVTLVDLKTPDEWVNAVVEGEVDAVATAEPNASTARERLGTNAVSWSAHSGQPMYGLVVASQAWLRANPALAEKFLRALTQAEDYVVTNPDGAKAIVRDALGLDSGSMEAVWKRNQFSLTLDQSLIAAMEDETRWLIQNDLTTQTSVPDFVGYVWGEGLRAVRPEAVNLIGSSSQSSQ